MQASTNATAGLGNPAAAPFRELTLAETDHVSGGVFPIVLVGTAIVATIIQASCGGTPPAPPGSSDDDESQD